MDFRRIHQKFFWIGSLVVFLISQKDLRPQVEPKPPKLPKEPIVLPERDARGDKEKEKIFLKVTLCDGRQVSGSWDNPEIQKEITFRHTKDGILYTKTLPLETIRMITIHSWKSELQKREKQGDSYKWKPHLVTIQTKSGESFTKEDGLEGTQFAILTIENNFGKAYLYSLWMDLLYKDGKWYSNLKPLDPKENREDCFKDVWKQLEFP